MPDPSKKISDPTLDACERNVICTGIKISAENNAENIKPEDKIEIEECINPCAKDTVEEATASPKVKKASAKATKGGSAAKSKKKAKSVKEKPAVLNEEPCPPGPTCQMARPDTDPKARVDKTKSGCMDFEKCDDDDDDEDEDEAEKTGCQNFEDCKDLAKDEKKRIKERKEKHKKKESAQPVTDENPCPK